MMSVCHDKGSGVVESDSGRQGGVERYMVEKAKEEVTPAPKMNTGSEWCHFHLALCVYLSVAAENVSRWQENVLACMLPLHI